MLLTNNIENNVIIESILKIWVNTNLELQYLLVDRENEILK